MPLVSWAGIIKIIVFLDMSPCWWIEPRNRVFGAKIAFLVPRGYGSIVPTLYQEVWFQTSKLFVNNQPVYISTCIQDVCCSRQMLLTIRTHCRNMTCMLRVNAKYVDLADMRYARVLALDAKSMLASSGHYTAQMTTQSSYFVYDWRPC